MEKSMDQITCGKIEHAHQEWMCALDAFKDAIVMFDQDFKILRCNKAYQEYAGMPYKQIIGIEYFDIFPKSPEPILPLQAIKNINTTIENEIKVEETFFRTITYSILDKEGRYIYSVMTLENITAYKKIHTALLESEEQFKSITSFAHDAIIMIDDEGKVSFWNEAATRIFGFTQEEAMHQILHELITPQRYLQDHRKAFGDFRKTGQGAAIGKTLELAAQRKDGSEFPIELSLSSVRKKGRWYAIGLVRDISDRKLAEVQLQESEKRYRTIYDGVLDGILLADVNTKQILEGNKAVQQMLGYENEELHMLKVSDLHQKEDIPFVLEQFEKQAREEIFFAENIPMKRKNGSLFYADISTSVLCWGEQQCMLGVFRDVTERKKTQERLKLFSMIIDHSTDAIEVIEADSMRIIDVNERACEMLGYKKEELLEKTVKDIDPLMASNDATVKKQLGEQKKAFFQTLHQHKDGTTFPVEINLELIELDKKYLLSHVQDITERLNNKKLLRQSEDRFRSIIESTNDWIWEINEKEVYTYASPQVKSILGYEPEEVLNRSPFEFMSKEEAKRTGEIFAEHRKDYKPIINLENECVHKNGQKVILETSGSAFFDENGKYLGYRGIDRDVTERKLAERSINRAHRALMTLSAGNIALIHAKTENELLQTVVDIIVKKGGYDLAMVCYAQEDLHKTIVPKAWSGSDESYFWEGSPSWADNENGQFPISKAIREQKTHVCISMYGCEFIAWKDAIIKRGFNSNIALPLIEGTKAFGTLTIYSKEKEPFDVDEIKLLEELANDLAYGIITLRVKNAHEEHEKILQESLEQSIQTIAATLEARDPYTAGHQERVSELAVAIAEEMELPQEQIRGISFAAKLHDLGKIHVPIEILSKPTKLNEFEYKLIQMHPQTGYDILKDIHFPWPIAQIILQHHEKINGKGYPNGLKGDEILLEAKIVAVADIVEAMSSHRPYRASVGIRSAIKEIKQGRGEEYDVHVVDACIKVLEEKNFTFSTHF